jgi:hypothetical protein
MPEIFVNRNNCSHGLWAMPDGKKVPIDKMVEYYISSQEGQPIKMDDLTSFSYRFIYADPKTEASGGAHNAPGRVEIFYTRK